MSTSSPQRDLQRHIGGRITALQKRYRADEPGAAADLARLRRAIRTAPGADPAVWSVMFERWPASLQATSDEPTWAENAAHAAVCLFAVHQQSSRDKDMHLPSTENERGPTLGAAVGSLSRGLGPDAEKAVKRRFDAVVTATDLTEILHHGRGLITQLRAAKVPLDYGRFAADLYRLQTPWGADQVRLQWARDYYQSLSRSDDKKSTELPANEGTN